MERRGHVGGAERHTETLSDSHALFLPLCLSALFPFFSPVNPLVFLLFISSRLSVCLSGESR